jgi:cytochrome c biogenesis protein ResB
MNSFRHAMMWAALALILLLIFLSIYGAFLGADGAKAFFNSLPSVLYWSALCVLLIAAIAGFSRLRRIPALLLIHLGCVLVIAGSMWGSQKGHQLQKRLSGIDKILEGRMIIYEGDSENQVVLPDGEQVKQLPFSIRLKDFRIAYYEPEYINIETRHGQRWKIPIEVGTEFPLSPHLGTVTITRAFRNFKIIIDGDKKIADDDPNAGSNPAVEVQITDPNGLTTTKYVFEYFAVHSHPQDRFFISYDRVIKDFISDLKVVQNGKIAAAKEIQVNHPLHFGGYHFYQHSYDSDAGRYTVLSVASDTGLSLVYAAYLMLCAGVFWHFWFRHVFNQIRSKTK